MTENTDIAARIVAETTLDAVIYADRSGVIRVWNDAASTIFGHAASHAVGQSLDLIIPEKHRGAHWAGWDRVMDTGVTRYGTEPLAAPGITADGERVSLEFSITILTDPAGEIEGIAAILRDVSRKWEQEKELRGQLKQAQEQAGCPVAHQ